LKQSKTLTPTFPNTQNKDEDLIFNKQYIRYDKPIIFQKKKKKIKTKASPFLYLREFEEIVLPEIRVTKVKH